MNLENIIVIGICFIAIAIVAYCFYNKYTSQQNDMNALSKRFETIEMMFATPPSQNELSDVYNKKHKILKTGPTTPTQPPTNLLVSQHFKSTDIINQQNSMNNRPIEISWVPSRRDPSIDQVFSTPEPVRSIPTTISSSILESFVTSKIDCDGLCDLQPLQIETNDKIFDDDINQQQINKI
jgi:hypothetical protein